MSQAEATPQHKPAVKQRSSVLRLILWDTPWRLIGMLFISLLISILFEFIGITFLWPEEGAEHSRQIMLTESGYFSEGFRRSLLLSQPVTTVNNGLEYAYAFLFVDSGFLSWLERVNQYGSSHWGLMLIQGTKEYLLATVYITVIFLLRVTILVLSMPLFVLVAVVAFFDGASRRDLRRYGAAHESSFVYHHAKRLIGPTLSLTCMLYLSLPFAIYPNALLLPAALLLGYLISTTITNFKKYL